MGGLLSYIFGGKTSAEFINDPKLDVVDSKSGLTPRQKLVIRETWSLVQRDLRLNGVEFFMALFKRHPDYQGYFKSFADVPIDKLRDNKKLHAHASSVMYAISSIVDSLDDIECLAEILKKTGKNHRPREVTITHFENLASVLVDFLAHVLGNSVFTPFARSSWEKVLHLTNAVIKTGMEEE